MEPPRVGEGALVELDDVAPAVGSEVLHHRVPNDSGADHHHLGAGREVAHSCLLCLPLSPSGSTMRNLLTIRNESIVTNPTG